MSYLIPNIQATKERAQKNPDLLFSDPNANYPFYSWVHCHIPGKQSWLMCGNVKGLYSGLEQVETQNWLVLTQNNIAEHKYSQI